VFERGWPTAPAEWRRPELETPMAAILELRALVNRQLESCRAAGQLGASLEAQVQLELGGDGSGSAEATGSAGLAAALAWLAGSAHPAVDNLADWLLVSALRIGGEPPAPVLQEAEEAGVRVRVARAAGEKCERCWHYESDIGEHSAHPTLCGRCVGVLGG
jgi:isoleucyl-tRNA synthetase